MDFNKKIEEIISILTAADETLAVKQFSNGVAMGLMPGERLSIISCVLKTYETGNYNFYDLIREPSESILCYASSFGILPRANFGLLDELSAD